MDPASPPRRLGREWAEASARTLYRRLRPKPRAELGHDRASALQVRTKMFRDSPCAHRRLADEVGAVFPSFADQLAGQQLLCRDRNDDALVQLRDGANWARHAPPPGALGRVRSLPQGIPACTLEQFRAGLFESKGCGAWAAECFDALLTDEQFTVEAATVLDEFRAGAANCPAEAHGGAAHGQMGQCEREAVEESAQDCHAEVDNPGHTALSRLRSWRSTRRSMFFPDVEPPSLFNEEGLHAAELAAYDENVNHREFYRCWREEDDLDDKYPTGNEGHQHNDDWLYALPYAAP